MAKMQYYYTITEEGSFNNLTTTVEADGGGEFEHELRFDTRAEAEAHIASLKGKKKYAVVENGQPV